MYQISYIDTKTCTCITLSKATYTDINMLYEFIHCNGVFYYKMFCRPYSI